MDYYHADTWSGRIAARIEKQYSNKGPNDEEKSRRRLQKTTGPIEEFIKELQKLVPPKLRLWGSNEGVQKAMERLESVGKGKLLIAVSIRDALNHRFRTVAHIPGSRYL